jgi:hypothetical protein
MARPYCLAFKQKMLEQLTGKNALSAVQLARQTGHQQPLPAVLRGPGDDQRAVRLYRV